MRTGHTRSLISVLERLPTVASGVEIGVDRGVTSELLLKRFPDLVLWMIDCWTPFPRSSTMGEVTAEDVEKKLRSVYERTGFAADRRIVLQMYSERAAKFVPDGSVDFVFIDGSHFYEDVRSDIRNFESKLRSGGVMSGHDYDGMGDRRKGWGVKRAVDEYFGEGNVSLARRNVWWLKL